MVKLRTGPTAVPETLLGHGEKQYSDGSRSHVKHFTADLGPSRARHSSVGIATRYGLDGPGIEFRCGGEIFRARPDRSCGPPSLLYNGYRVSPGG